MVNASLSIIKTGITNSQTQIAEGNNTNINKKFDLSTEIDENINSEYTILIDAGHGGSDNGSSTLDKEVYEKDIVLELAKKVAKQISVHKDMQVIVSRKDDVTLNDEKRTEIANTQRVDLFVSIHLNSHQGSWEAKGIETYYTAQGTSGSRELAEKVQSSMMSYVIGKDRGVKEAKLKVLEQCNMPAIQIEAGFITDKEDSKNLQDEEYQDQLSQGIAQGIISYLDQKKGK